MEGWVKAYILFQCVKCWQQVCFRACSYQRKRVGEQVPWFGVMDSGSQSSVSGRHQLHMSKKNRSADQQCSACIPIASLTCPWLSLCISSDMWLETVFSLETRQELLCIPGSQCSSPYTDNACLNGLSTDPLPTRQREEYRNSPSWH